MKTLKRAALRNFDHPEQDLRRKGAFIVLALVCFVGCLMFVCFSVDIGYLEVHKTRMQNAVDAAALAAAQEITAAIQNAPEGTVDVTAYSLASARTVAANVAQMNGVHVNSATDVRFGTRTLNTSTGKFSVNWGATPANIVEVSARRTHADPSRQDGKLRLFFANLTGDGYARVSTKAAAYIEARDLVVVHDFSRSMNFDSQFSDEAVSRLSDEQIKTNLGYIWSDLNLNLGNMKFEPEYLFLSERVDGVDGTATFRYENVDITTSAELKSAVVEYQTANGSKRTKDYPTLTGKSATLELTRDATAVTFVSKKTTPAKEETQTTSRITVTYPADRKSSAVSSPNRLRNLEVNFTNGTSTSMSWTNAQAQTSYTYSGNKQISYVRVRTWNSSSGGTTSYVTFNAPATETTVEVTHTFTDNNTNVRKFLGLSNTSYPFPSGSWDEYIDHCRTYAPFAENGRQYRETYGGLTFANYLIRMRSSHAETPKLCETRHYPFSAIKEGHELLCQFLADLGFDDHLGMVSFDTNHRVEKVLNTPGYPYVNVTAKPITTDYVAVNNLMKYKQANHYSAATNMGGGLMDAIDLLDNHKRVTARPTIILMTDGNPNTIDRGESSSLPSGWSWNDLLDYDGDGAYNYFTNDNNKRYVLKKAYEAANKGYTLHTMSVGMDGDRDLMQAIAHIGGGHFIDVPGGFSVIDMEEQIKAAFHKIASHVPPPKLINE